jgi:hypothetical protein
MARFVCELDESDCRMRKERKEKINFVFDINCFMILVACVYLCVLFFLNSDSLRIKREKTHKRERAIHFFWSCAQESGSVYSSRYRLFFWLILYRFLLHEAHTTSITMEILRAETNEFPHLKVCIWTLSILVINKNPFIEYRWSNKWFIFIINNWWWWRSIFKC